VRRSSPELCFDLCLADSRLPVRGIGSAECLSSLQVILLPPVLADFALTFYGIFTSARFV
jgi:hypothetical protein